MLASKGILLLFLVSAVGCWGPDKKAAHEKLANDSANFKVLTPQFIAAEQGSVQEYSWKIPRIQNYIFEVCVEDDFYQKKITNQRFQIEKGQQVFQVVSDDRGCMQWQEPVAYNLFALSQFVYEPRRIRALGAYKGVRDIHCFVNPWGQLNGSDLKGQEAICLNRKEQISEYDFVGLNYQVGPKALSAESQSSLWIKNLRVNITHRNYVDEEIDETGESVKHLNKDKEFLKYMTDKGYRVSFPEESSGLPIHIDFNFKPFSQLKNSAGHSNDYLLKGGQYKVWAYVVATDFGENKSERRILNPLSEPKIARFFDKDQSVRASIQTMITEQARDANYHLLIRLRPLNAPVDLGSFEAVYNFSIDWTSLLGQKSPFLEKDNWEHDGRFAFDEYLGSMDNFDVVNKVWKERAYDAPEAYKLPTYEYDTLEVRFKRIQPGETATTRTVELRAKTCMSHTKNGRRVQNRKFLLKRIRDDRAGKKDANGDWLLMPQSDPGPPEELVTDHRGCLRWTDVIRHKYYMPEKYIFPRAEIWDPENPKERKTLTLVVNPWDEKWTFGHDRRDLTKKYLDSIRDRKTVQSRFFLTNYAYQTLRFRYYIDKYMNLTVRKTVLLRLDPTVLRYSSIVYGRRGTERLRDGIYLMKVAMQKNYLDPAAKGLVIKREKPLGEEIVSQSGAARGFTDNRTRLEGIRFHKKGTETYYETRGDKDPEEGLFDTDIGANLRQREYITVVKKLVRVQDGKIITPVEFSMRDLRLMKIRSNFLVQLETIREEDLLKVNILKEKLRNQVEQALVDSEAVRNMSVREQVQLMERIGQDQSSLMAEVKLLSQKGVKLNDRMISIVDLLSGNPARLIERMSQGLEPEPTTQTPQGFVDNSEFIQGLFEELDIEPEIRNQVNQETLEAIKLNDFTMYDTSPFGMSFDHLIDKNSGLSARTFVGPLTLIFNSNHSNIRPTDNLNENFCEVDDCNELKFGISEDYKRGRYENSEFFGSIRHLRGIHVDQLIQKKFNIESRYLTEMAASSLIYNFVDFHNLEFTSLRDERLIRFSADNEKCRTIGQTGYFDFDFSDYEESDQIDKPMYFLGQRGCLKHTQRRSMKSNVFLDRLNQLLVKHKRFTKNDVKNVIDDFYERDNLSVREKLAKNPGEDYRELMKTHQGFFMQLCGVLSTVFHSGSDRIKTWNKSLKRACRAYVEEGKIDEAFAIEKKYRVYGTTGNYNFKGGKSMNVNVGDSFSVSRGDKVDFGGKFHPLGEFIGQASGGLLGLTWGMGQAKVAQEGTTVTSQTFLVMQTAALDIELAKYEKCLVFRWKPAFLAPNEALMGMFQWDRHVDWYKADPSAEEQEKVFFGGLLLCKGEVEKEPMAVRERYYYMTQHFTDGDMLDPGDLYNHPWLLQLRGVRDFETFIRGIRAQHIEFVSEDDRYFTKPLHSSSQWPIEKLNESYRNILPTFPGVFTQLMRVSEEADYPWVIDADVSYYNERVGQETTYENSWGLEEKNNWIHHWRKSPLAESLRKLKGEE